MDKRVDNCPRNLTETVVASTRLGCGRDKYGNDQYMCLPNIEKTGLVEFCHNGIMGIIERGYCLKTAEDKLFTHKCLKFVSGCPDIDFRSNEIYKYPACQNISTEHRCYLADPSCPNDTSVISTEETTGTLISKFTTNHVTYSRITMDIHATTYPEDDSAHIVAIVGSLMAVMTLILLLIIARVAWKRMRRQKEQGKDEFSRTLNKGEGEAGVSSELKNNESDVIDYNVSIEKEERAHFIAKNCVNNVQTYGENGFKLTDFKSEPEERGYDVIEASVERESQAREHVVSVAGGNSGSEEREQTVIEADIQTEPEKRECGSMDVCVKRYQLERDVKEIGVNSKPDEIEPKKIHSVSETGDQIESGGREQTAVEVGIQPEPEKRTHGALKDGVIRVLQERQHDITETRVSSDPDEMMQGLTEADIFNQSQRNRNDRPIQELLTESREHIITEVTNQLRIFGDEAVGRYRNITESSSSEEESSDRENEGQRARENDRLVRQLIAELYTEQQRTPLENNPISLTQVAYYYFRTYFGWVLDRDGSQTLLEETDCELD